jgi:phospholipid-transporting ATPase
MVSYLNSEPQALCYVETSNLDGETNLKIRQAVPETARLLEIKDLTQFTGTLECEQPNRHLYEFSGILKETNKQYVKFCFVKSIVILCSCETHLSH